MVYLNNSFLWPWYELLAFVKGDQPLPRVVKSTYYEWLLHLCIFKYYFTTVVFSLGLLQWLLSLLSNKEIMPSLFGCMIRKCYHCNEFIEIPRTWLYNLFLFKVIYFNDHQQCSLIYLAMLTSSLWFSFINLFLPLFLVVGLVHVP